jgi:uncharacterized protein
VIAFLPNLRRGVGWLHRSSTTRYWCDSAAQWTPRSATGSSGSCCSVRARGEAGEDSDYDIAVFLRGFTERWPEVDRLVEIETDLLYQIGAFVHALPFGAGAWQERSPLMAALRRDGVDL